MMTLRSCRAGLLALGGAGALLLLGYPALQQERTKLEQLCVERAQEGKTLRQHLMQLNRDMALAQSLSQKFDAATVERLLAPVDRRKIVARWDALARAARLAHFSYTLGPEQRDADTGLVLSTLTLSGEAPHEDAILGFLQQLHGLLPGRVAWQNLHVERIDPEGAALASRNLRFSASLQWLANGGDAAGTP